MTVNKTFIVRNQRLYFFGKLIEKPPFPPKILGKTEVVIIWTGSFFIKIKTNILSAVADIIKVIHTAIYFKATCLMI